MLDNINHYGTKETPKMSDSENGEGEKHSKPTLSNEASGSADQQSQVHFLSKVRSKSFDLLM